MSIKRIQPGRRLSEAVVAGDLVFLAGQVPNDTGKDITGQTAEVLAAIDAVLAEAGTDKSKLVDATIFLANIADYDGMNAAWDAWVDGANPPSRATVEARLANPAWKVEIKVVASR